MLKQEELKSQKEVKNNMVVKNSKKKSTAEDKAKDAREKGFTASVFKKKKGYGTSVTSGK